MEKIIIIITIIKIIKIKIKMQMFKFFGGDQIQNFIFFLEFLT